MATTISKPVGRNPITTVGPFDSPFDQQQLEDTGFLTAMTLVLLGNYAQTGHYGGPLAYTPYNVAVHLAGPKLGGLRYDYRRPKHPYGDKFMLAGGHCIPTCYALWIIMGEAMARQFAATGDKRYQVDPNVAMLSIDALGFRRGPGAVATLLKDFGLENDPLFAQAKLRGIRVLSGHAESVDVTNDVNGGPSGVGLAVAAGKAAFWDIMGAPIDGPKVIAFEGEFALTEGHAQELKTQALALKNGKRLRLMVSDNNNGIDDSLMGGVIDSKYESYNLADQWTSYGWQVFTIEDGNDYAQVVGALKAMEDADPNDRRPIVLIGKTVKGWWPEAPNGELPGSVKQIIHYASHPYAHKMNAEYFRALASTFEKRFGVKFDGIQDGPVKDRDRLVQFKTNMDIAMSVLEKSGLGEWIANRLVEIGDQVKDDLPLRVSAKVDPFLDERLLVKNLPVEPQKVKAKQPFTNEEKEFGITLFRKAGEVAGTRRGISEIVKWVNYVTDGRFFTIAADLSESINLEHGNLWGHYDPEKNPAGTRLKAAIQEAGNASTAIGLVSQSISVDPDKFAGVWAISGTYGAFTPLMYLPARVWSQQTQDSKFRMGVLHILAGHSGPETAADFRTHFGIFAPQVWKLFPRGSTIHLSFWDYNDVAPGYFAAAEIAAREARVGVISIEVARPDFPVADRSKFADMDLKAAAKGLYVIRDFAPGPRHGYIVSQGSSSTVNLVSVLPKLEAAGINVKVIAAISEELFDRQPESYRNSVLPPEAYYDLMFVSTGTRRMWPIRNSGPLTDEYSMTSDYHNEWLTGGLEPDVIAEAHLDAASIFAGVERFARDREQRMSRQRDMLQKL